MGTFKSPTPQELKKYNRNYHFACTNQELKVFSEILKHYVAPFNTIYKTSNPVPKVKYPRTPGYRPEKDENPLKAWYMKCSVKGERAGKLAGKKIALKDTVFVAGIQMMNGSRILEGFTPDFDATIVERILEEGGEIVGKTTCEDLCYSGASYLTTYGPVRNPWNLEHSAGGSSSGSAVLVATGEVDVAVGGDQGGSIRMPSSQCGIVGMKPTFGLVPYTGVCSLDFSLDSVGPMASNVHDCALLLEVMAGFDANNDARQSIPFHVPEYSKELDKPVSDLKIGILKEGFENCDSDVIEVLNNVVDVMKTCGIFSEISYVSAPHHSLAREAVMVLCVRGLTQVLDGNGHGTGIGGLLSSRLSNQIFSGLKAQGHSLVDSVKLNALLAAYIKEKYGLTPYARAHNLLLKCRKLYDDLFEKIDILLMPTVTKNAGKIPDLSKPIEERVNFSKNQNTAPFNGTHHPAITINAGFSKENGLPVGVMLVGKRWQDSTILRAAHAMEKILKTKVSHDPCCRKTQMILQ